MYLPNVLYVRLRIVIAHELHPLEHTVRTLATLNYWLFIVLKYTYSKKFQGDNTIHTAHTAVQVPPCVFIICLRARHIIIIPYR